MSGFSKGRLLSGAQCPKLLWLRVHEPDAPELVPGPATQALFDAGIEVGERAREEFHDGVLVELDRRKPAAAIAETRRLLAHGDRPIFEAAVAVDGVFVAVDVLEPSGAGWVVNEVKAATRLKEHHILDVAVQVHVLRAAGLEVAGARLMHLNRDCRFPHLGDLFVREDISESVEAELEGVPSLIDRLLAVLEGQMPDTAPGPHCRRPYSCPFTGRCATVMPKHPVGEFYRLHETKRQRLAVVGAKTIAQVPESFALTETQGRQRRAIVHDRLIVEPGLAKALDHGIHGPESFLDFETVALPIPRWVGCRPWDQVPVQFSLHREGEDGLEHLGWLAEGGADPRPELARVLVAAAPPRGPVYVYYEPFERGRLRELAEAVPELKGELLAIEGRIVDLLPVVRRHVYDREFKGSFSIKAVVPVLCPGEGWDGLDVASGDVAAAELRQVLFSANSAGAVEQHRKREALMRYCERDTYSMVSLLQRLRELAESSRAGTVRNDRAANHADEVVHHRRKPR